MYRLECADFGKYNIGKTGRAFITRPREHISTTRATVTAAKEQLKKKARL